MSIAGTLWLCDSNEYDHLTEPFAAFGPVEAGVKSLGPFGGLDSLRINGGAVKAGDVPGSILNCSDNIDTAISVDADLILVARQDATWSQ